MKAVRKKGSPDVGYPDHIVLTFLKINTRKLSDEYSLPGSKEAPICCKGINTKFQVEYG